MRLTPPANKSSSERARALIKERRQCASHRSSMHSVVAPVSDLEHLSEIAIEAMEMAVEMGNIRSLDACVSSWSSLIDDERDEKKALRLEAILKFLSKGRSIEENWGQGSMLDHDHPAVKRWVMLGLIEPSHIDAARNRPASLGIVYGSKRRWA